MIDFISDKKEFEEQTEEKNGILLKDIHFPQKVFKDLFYRFLFFDFDYIYSAEFYQQLLHFLRLQEKSFFTFYTITPDPVTYFYKHFQKYSVAKISIDKTHKDYLNFLNLDPGNPADCLFSNGVDISIFAKKSHWGIVGSKDWEIAIIGFSDIKSINDFEKAFYPNIGDGKFFDTIESYIEEFGKMFNWDHIPKGWLEFRENYSK